MKRSRITTAAVTLAALALAFGNDLLPGDPPTGPPPTTAEGQVREVKLAWDPNPEPDIAGYRLHYGEASGVYTTSVDVGNVTTSPLELPLDKVSYTVVTVYNTAGLESLPSNELTLDFTLPARPTGLFVAPADNP